ncbi:MAG: PIG-L deacetylase family protein [Allosphingosinicella sp.]
MTMFEQLERVLVVAPHADDEVLGCGGLLARLAEGNGRAHVVFMSVDGFHHYGLSGGTSFEDRIKEVEAVARLLGFTWEIVYPNQDMIEKLDTVPKRDLVDRFEKIYNEHRPQLLLLPCFVDYDQDHRRTFETAFAAARPISPRFGKWLIPMVLAYEQNKLNFAWQDLPKCPVYLDISAQIEKKIASIEAYATQLRPAPHVRSIDGVRALARIRGADIGVDYAEGFPVFRAVL